MCEGGDNIGGSPDYIMAMQAKLLRWIEILEELNAEIIAVGSQDAWDSADPHATAVMLRVMYRRLCKKCRLPTPSSTALKVCRMVLEGNPDSKALAEVVSADEAILSRLLKLANCALYARENPTTTAEDAAKYLGDWRVLQIALSATVIDCSRRGPCEGFDYGSHWSESVAQATAAKCAAKGPESSPDTIKGSDSFPEESFVVGLFCQVGRLAFATSRPNTYSKLLSRSDAEAYELARVEKEIFQINHSELASLMMSDWGLPTWMCRAVRYQYPEQVRCENVSDDREVESIELLRYSRRCARAMAVGWAPLSLLGSIVASADGVGIEHEGFRRWYDDTLVQWQEMGDVLNLATLSGPPWDDLCDKAICRSSL